MNKTMKFIAVICVLLIISISTVFETESSYMNMIKNVRATKADSLDHISTTKQEDGFNYMKLIYEIRANKAKAQNEPS